MLPEPNLDSLDSRSSCPRPSTDCNYSRVCRQSEVETRPCASVLLCGAPHLTASHSWSHPGPSRAAGCLHGFGQAGPVECSADAASWDATLSPDIPRRIVSRQQEGSHERKVLQHRLSQFCMAVCVFLALSEQNPQPPDSPDASTASCGASSSGMQSRS